MGELYRLKYKFLSKVFGRPPLKVNPCDIVTLLCVERRKEVRTIQVMLLQYKFRGTKDLNYDIVTYGIFRQASLFPQTFTSYFFIFRVFFI
jgi:hypothetical protein